MPTRVWSGASLDGNMATAGNYVGGAAPSAADTVIFDRGSNPVTAWAGVALASVVVTPGYSGYFGTSGSPVTIADTVTSMKIGGKQTGVYLSVNTLKEITTLSVESGSVSISGAGTIVTANVCTGATLNATITAVTTLNVVTPDSSCIAASSATAITTANVIGRLESTDRSITTINVGGSGRVITKGTAAFTTATIGNGGTLNKQSSSTDGSAIVQFGGTFTNEGNTYMYSTGGGAAATVGTVTLWTGSKFIPNGVGNSLTITNPIVYIGAAGGDRPFDPIG